MTILPTQGLAAWFGYPPIHKEEKKAPVVRPGLSKEMSITRLGIKVP
jgi:hypothetical protein